MPEASLCVDIALPKADTALGLLPEILPHEELALNFQSHNQKHLFAISLPLLRFARQSDGVFAIVTRTLAY